jgi:hypothetical protein
MRIAWCTLDATAERHWPLGRMPQSGSREVLCR